MRRRPVNPIAGRLRHLTVVRSVEPLNSGSPAHPLGAAYRDKTVSQSL